MVRISVLFKYVDSSFCFARNRLLEIVSRTLVSPLNEGEQGTTKPVLGHPFSIIAYPLVGLAVCSYSLQNGNSHCIVYFRP